MSERDSEAAALLMKARNSNEQVIILPAQTTIPEERSALLQEIRDMTSLKL